MTTLAEIIQQAYRDANLVPIGTDTTTTAEKAEGLKRLQVIILSVLGMEGGEMLKPFPIGSNNVTTSNWIPTVPDFMPLNIRMICNLSAATTLYLHPSPQDGSRLALVDASSNFATFNLTLDGNGRLVNGGTTDVRTTDDESVQFFYRADLADWLELSSLDEADEMPFPVEFDDMFVIMLAMRLNPRNAQTISTESMAMVERSREQFRARYAQTVNIPADLGTRRLSRQTYPNGWGYGDISNAGMLNT